MKTRRKTAGESYWFKKKASISGTIIAEIRVFLGKEWRNAAEKRFGYHMVFVDYAKPPQRSVGMGQFFEMFAAL